MLKFPLLRWLWAMFAALLVGHVIGLVLWVQRDVPRDSGVWRQFDLNGEANLAAWFESFIILTCAALVLLLASHARESGAALAHRWTALSAVLLLMSMDEASQLHDMFTGPLRRGLEIDFGVFYFAWLIPAVAFLAFFAWYFAPLALTLPAAIRNRLLAAFGIYFGGAIVVEMVSGFAVEYGRKSTPYLTVLTFEETCEIAGMLLVVGAFFAFVRLVQPRTVIDLGGAGGTVALSSAEAAATLDENKNTF
ncbi:hypothetical protein F0U44_04360 [Nocardioides humilatus]|uniref:Uncharacterized protein n=1 Tax=Nocardioides humilatus TaxID=2607660 RepID=A0A5B1LPN4_9ACTN|nr:hypothetical protein [Nocardioides humilatus]KAA1421527.1 hypothetical protein F0U44_04360 [Nocardioides humilatus]